MELVTSFTISAAMSGVYHVLHAPFVKRRMRQLAVMPNVALGAEHTRFAKLLPNRLDLLDVLPKGGTVAEIGVADGDFSTEILARCQPNQLHLVDLWQGDRYRLGKTKVEQRFDAQITAGQVVLNRGYSTDVMKTFPDHVFDWVYIDTDHTYSTTAAELLLAARIVKPAGRILGHDFCTASAGRGVVYGVVQAVHEFCAHRGWQIEYIALDPTGHFSFCLMQVPMV